VKRGAILLALVVLMAGAIGGLAFWMAQPRARVPATEVTFETLSPEYGAIRIRGTAHYRGVVHQRVGASLASGPQEYWVYALFPVHDTEGREIKLLVRSDKKPPSRVDYEFVELEGWLDPPKSNTLPLQTQKMMSQSGYFWDEVLVLTPWRSESFDPADL